MQTKNVYYSARPDAVIVTGNGKDAIVEIPVGVTEIETEDGKQWIAETVYSLRTFDRVGLKESVEANYDAWLVKAKETEPQAASLADIVDALNALTDLVLGGM